MEWMNPLVNFSELSSKNILALCSLQLWNESTFIFKTHKAVKHAAHLVMVTQQQKFQCWFSGCWCELTPVNIMMMVIYYFEGILYKTKKQKNGGGDSMSERDWEEAPYVLTSQYFHYVIWSCFISIECTFRYIFMSNYFHSNKHTWKHTTHIVTNQHAFGLQRRQPTAAWQHSGMQITGKQLLPHRKLVSRDAPACLTSCACWPCGANASSSRLCLLIVVWQTVKLTRDKN